ncbi:cobaltochelatase subunit CobN [Phaeobacter sp.]|uniref:cobaltochelatase subunit CobN n=1 Tax=Phaeobacter sp. TaxID=1902409 RepID=UPI0025E46F0A|nr:cobaltochelatase subunit CobN [Phaeobacter sp.]
MLDKPQISPRAQPYRVVIITLDAHAAGPVARASLALAKDFPGLQLSVHASAEWAECAAAKEKARTDLQQADIVICTLLFLDEHIRAILPDLQNRRDACDAVVGIISEDAIVRCTKLGDLDMAKPSSGVLGFLKKLRGPVKKTSDPARAKMQMLRRLPKILRFVPGKAQDLRNWFLCMQYWLGGSDENIEQMVRFLLSRYASRPEWRGADANLPIEYPEVGLYHPDLPNRVCEDIATLQVLRSSEHDKPTVGVLMLRSYVLSADCAHYDAVIRALEDKGLRVIPAFAGGLDARPAIAKFMQGDVDALLSLTGFSLVGGPAYNDTDAAVATLKVLDVPYIAAHPLEFQTIDCWRASTGGLGPVETTMLISLPEIDGATNPTVFAGRRSSVDVRSDESDARALMPISERVAALAEKTEHLAKLRQSKAEDRKTAIVLYGFPPNAGAVGTAAYLDVFQSLFNVLRRMKAEGHQIDLPQNAEALRCAILEGNAADFGQSANVADIVSADELVRTNPWLDEIEAQWGPAPGRHQSDGRGVYILGQHFGSVFVGVQPVFGYEGDPMRLLFEKGFAPTHAFAAFYQWLKHRFEADVLLHFGMHGALEFMPGKQAGLSGDCWPDRLIGNLPNVYLYAANNPSEASLAKRRSNAITVTHLTPPTAQSGLYKGLQDLKDSVTRWRETAADAPKCHELEELIKAQAEAVDLTYDNLETLWLQLLDTEQALIPDGLHVVGAPMSADQRQAVLDILPEMDEDQRADMDDALARDTETPALIRALGGHFIPPVPGGDLIRAPQILPTGRNIHAFDPFRMPTAYALADGKAQADRLLATHPSLPRSIALVLWGSDNIKSDGSPIGQALALLGARPRFDRYGRLCSAELIPLEELGRPRIDVLMTVSGIFRDLLPLQIRLLAEAAWLAAHADEPLDMNFVRANTLRYADRVGCDQDTAALRVFSNAEGAYGSNVNLLVDGSSFNNEDELADAFEARKSYAYGRDGKPAQQAELLQQSLADVEVAYQNLESVELGVTTVDHYFDTLGGVSRAIKRARGKDADVYISDQTRGDGKIRTLKDQIALETRSRSLNPKFYEGLLRHGREGVRYIEAHVTNTLGWSATTGQVDPWVYQRISETFVLDDDMRQRLATLNPEASMRMANRLLEAHDRDYWQPDAETLAALQGAADEIEDRLEGIAAQ